MFNRVERCPVSVAIPVRVCYGREGITFQNIYDGQRYLLMSIAGKTLLIVSHQFSEGKLGAFDRVLNFAGKTAIE
jgi:hypothetical protein